MPSPSTIKFNLLADSGFSDADKLTSSGIIEVLGLEAGPNNTWQYSLDYGRTWSPSLPVASTVPGIKVELFEGIGFTGTLRSTKAETTINFADSYDTRFGGNGDTFSLRLTGQIQAYTNGTNTFKVGSDDGVRVWVNGLLVVDKWRDRGTTFDKFDIPGLTQGEWYDLKIEYYENGGSAALQLRNIDDTFVTALRSIPTGSTSGTNPNLSTTTFATNGRNLIDLPSGVYADGQVRVRQEVVQPLPTENLIQNGSFEKGWVGSSWTGLTSLPGWKTADRFEIWGKSMTPVSDGNYLLEIDYAGALDWISQAVSTVKDATYSLQFDMKSRGGGKESLEVFWRGEKLSTVNTASQNWTTFKFDVRGSGSPDELMLKELQSENNGSGSLIDNVRLIVTSLPQSLSSASTKPEEFLVPFKLAVDKSAPTVTLNNVGGRDKIVSSNALDRIITGKAEFGSTVSLSTRVVKSENFENGQINDWIKFDIPNTNVATIKLDTANGELDFLATGGRTNIWTSRDNAPMAWIARPTVIQNETWFIESKVRIDKRSQGETIAGITFYDDKNGGFQYGAPSFYLDGWASSGTNVTLQGLGNNTPFVTAQNTTTVTGDTAFVYLRSEITEKGASDDYKFFYKKNEADPWIQLGDVYKYSIDNSRAALFYKTGAAKAGGSSFDNLKVGMVNEVVLASNIAVNQDGTFSHSLSDAQLKQLGEGASKVIFATQADQAGNIGRSSEDIFAIDTVIAPVLITSIGGGDGKVSNQVVESGKGPLKFNLDQYTGYWSNKLSDLQNYVNKYNPLTAKNKYSVVTDAIDYTDDLGGFAGELNFDRRWPAAEALKVWGTGGINDQFFVKISGDFSIEKDGMYRFRTYNDDGVFLLVDGKFVISDSTLHPEQIFTGDISLSAGNHQLELYFFENGGEASLEFSVSAYDSTTKSWGAYKLMGQDSSIKAKSNLVVDNLIEGKGEALSPIYLKLGDKELGSTTTSSDGTFQYRMSNANLELLASSPSGSPLVAYQYDFAGNLSTSQSAQASLSEIPPVVLIQSVGTKDKVVTSNLGGNAVIGNGNPNLSTSIVFGDTELGRVMADNQGLFKYELTKENINTIGQGSLKNILVRQKTASGLVGTSSAFSFTIDTVAPILRIDKIGLGDGRLSKKNNIIMGTADPDSQVVLKFAGQELGRTKSDFNGKFQLVLSDQALENLNQKTISLPFTINAEQTDVYGNVGVFESSPMIVKLSPPVITISSIGGNDSIVSSQISDLTISGRAEADSPVSLWFNNILLGQTNPVNDNGDFIYTLVESDLKSLGQGSGKIITFKQTDNFGNQSTFASNPFTIDTVSPSIDLPSKASNLALGGVDGVMSTQFGDTILRGKGEANLDLEIVFNGHTRSLFANGVGDFSYLFDSNDIQLLGQGKNKQINISQSDKAGNKTNVLIDVNVDTIASDPMLFLVDTGSSSSDRITKSTIMSISGIEKGGTWQYSIDYGYSWSIDQLSDLTSFSIAAGLYSAGQVQAKQLDASGNGSDITTGFAEFTVDTAAAAPLLSLEDTGSSSVDRITKSSTIIVERVEMGATWQYSVDSGKTWSTDQPSSMTSFLLDTGLYASGQVRIRQADLAGNISVANSSFAGFTVDTTAAIAPSLFLVSDTGSSSSDRITRNTKISVSGVETGATWQYSIDFGENWSTVQPASTTSFMIADGVYLAGQVQVKQTDVAGNISEANTIFADFIFDTNAEEPTFLLEDTGASPSDRITNSTTIRVEGVETGATWQYSIDSGKTWSSAQLASTTSISIGAGLITRGQVKVKQIDLAGNNSEVNSSFDAFTVDIFAAAPTITLEDTGTSSSDRITNSTTIRVEGVETGATWQYSIDSGKTWSSAQPSTTTSFSIEAGLYITGQVQAKQTDLAGNDSDVNLSFASFTVDTVPAPAPSLSLVDTGSLSGDRITNNTTISIDGVETDSNWQFSIDSGNTWSTSQPASSTSFTIESGLYKLGQVQLKQTDLAGNSSEANIIFGSFTVDTIAAVAPSLSLVDTGSSPMDRITNNTLISVNDVETDATWQYSIDYGNSWSTSQLASTAFFEIVDGSYSTGQVRVKQTDVAGNTSVVNTTFAAFTVDTIAPAESQIRSIATDAIVSFNPNDNLVTGAADPKSAVSLLVNGKILANVQSDSKGLFNYAFSDNDIASIGQGTFQLQSVASDLAGNFTSSDSYAFKIDTIAPVKPIIFSIGELDSIVSTKGSGNVSETVDNLVLGSVEAGSKVQFFSGSKLLGSVIAGNDGNFSYALSYPNIALYGQGNRKLITAVSVDQAGNASSLSGQFEFSIDTIAPSSPKISSIGGNDGVLSTVQNDNKLIGVAEFGSTLEIRATSVGNILFSKSQIYVDTSGRWTYSLTKEELDKLDRASAASASTFIQAISTDSAGNESSSVAFTPMLDLLAPDLRIASIGGNDNVISGNSGDNLVIGNGELNSLVSISYNGKVLRTLMSDTKGGFAYAFTKNDLRTIGEGQNKQVSISQSDKAGNISSITKNFDVDITAPSIPSIQLIGGFDKIVTAGDPDRVVRGTGEADSTIELLLIAATKRISLATFKVDRNGEFNYILNADNLMQIGQGFGKSIVASSYDAAGNISMSKPFGFTVEGLWKQGTDKDDSLSFSSTVDVLTGLAGPDRFILPSLASCLISAGVNPSFDRLTDFQIGLDQIDAPTSIASGMTKDLGTLQTISTLHLGLLLNPVSFAANSSAVFRYEDSDMGQRTFLALNDNIKGFDSKRDAVIEITGFRGNLSDLTVI